MNGLEEAIDYIINEFPKKTVEKGLDYFQKGRVVECNQEIEGLKVDIKATVRGSDFYETCWSFNFRERVIENWCSCPLEYDCKHALSVLYKYKSGLGNSRKASFSKSFNGLASQNNQPTLLPESIPVIDKLDKDTESWLARIEKTLNKEQIKNHQSVEKNTSSKICYIVSSDYRNQLSIAIKNIRLLKDGSFSGAFFSNISLRSFPSAQLVVSAMSEEDCNIFTKILRTQKHFYDELSLNSEESKEILKCAIATGRCYFKSTNNPVLKWGDPVTATFNWKIDSERGVQRLICTPQSSLVDCYDPKNALYVTKKKDIIGELHFNENPDLVSVLIESPEIKVENNNLLKERLEAIQPLKQLAPEEFKKTVIQAKPTVVITLSVASHEPLMNTSFDYDDDNIEFAVCASFSFDYEGHILKETDPAETVSKKIRRCEEIAIIRDVEIEKEAQKRLYSLGWETLNPIEKNKKNYPLYGLDDSTDNFVADAVRVVNTQLTVFEKLGWRVEFSKEFPVSSIVKEDEWYAESDDAGGQNWFDVELGVLFGNERINLVELFNQISGNQEGLERLLDLLRKESDSYEHVIKVKDGVAFMVNGKKILNFFELLQSDFGDSINKNKLNLSRWNTEPFHEMLNAEKASKLRWIGPKDFQRLVDRSSVKTVPPVIPSKTFLCDLRPYQKEGVSWLQMMREMELNAILADDMGLGKTVQTIAHIVIEKESERMKGPILIVAPTSLMPNWVSEIKKFAPQLTYVLIHGNSRKQYFDKVGDYDIIFTTYPLLARDKEYLLKQPFYYMILDEAQSIKNSKTLTYQIVQQINAQHRLFLTGTPMENHLGELWALFNVLLPGLLRDEKSFNKNFKNPIQKEGDAKRMLSLTKRLKPFILRRTKAEVMLDLPEKTILIQHIEMNDRQRNIYEVIRTKAQKRVMEEIEKKGLSRSQIILLDALLKLRQVCCDPRLVKMEHESIKEAESSKLEFLKETLPQMIEEGRKIIIFSQFTTMLALIEVELVRLEIPYVILTGDTKDRDAPIRRFQNGEVPVILLSLKAGGVGLNLTVADTVIHYDPWWNPAVESQANDRAHRIGQKKAVFVYKLVMKDTLEEKILLLQDKKRALIEAIVDAKDSAELQLTLEDIKELFGANT